MTLEIAMSWNDVYNATHNFFFYDIEKVITKILSMWVSSVIE